MDNVKNDLEERWEELNARLNQMIEKNKDIDNRVNLVAEQNEILFQELVAITKAKGLGSAKLIAQNALMRLRKN